MFEISCQRDMRVIYIQKGGVSRFENIDVKGHQGIYSLRGREMSSNSMSQGHLSGCLWKGGGYQI